MKSGWLQGWGRKLQDEVGTFCSDSKEVLKGWWEQVKKHEVSLKWLPLARVGEIKHQNNKLSLLPRLFVWFGFMYLSM